MENMNQINNDKLIGAIEDYRNGNAEAFNVIYELTKKTIVAILRSFSLDEAMIEDLTQEIYIKLMKVIEGKEAIQNPFGLVKTITAHTAIDHQKKLSTRMESTIKEVANDEGDIMGMEEMFSNEDFLTAPIGLPEDIFDNNEILQAINNIIEGIPAKQREAIRLFYFNEMSIAEIAKLKETKETTVKQWLFTGRKSIEVGVLEYEKKNGVKLRSVAIVPFMLYLFWKKVEATTVPATLDTIVKTAVAGEVGAGTTVTTAVTGATAKTGAAATVKMVLVAAAGAAVVGLGILGYNISKQSASGNMSVVEEDQSNEALQESNSTATSYKVLHKYDLTTEDVENDLLGGLRQMYIDLLKGSAADTLQKTNDAFIPENLNSAPGTLSLGYILLGEQFVVSDETGNMIVDIKNAYEKNISGLIATPKWGSDWEETCYQNYNGLSFKYDDTTIEPGTTYKDIEEYLNIKVLVSGIYVGDKIYLGTLPSPREIPVQLMEKYNIDKVIEMRIPISKGKSSKRTIYASFYDGTILFPDKRF